jgi:hypothetical protein
MIQDTLWGFGDLLPMFSLRWNAGVNNYMVYVTGDIPVGAYNPSRLSNIGIGHGTVDGGFGYTYLNPKTGHEFSGVLGFTYNVANYQTQYQNGVDMHFDWGISQFLTKQFQIGVVGYVYDEIGCDSGSGDKVGCFQCRVFGVGPQVGFIIPISTTTQGLSEYQRLQGVRQRKSTGRLECLGHIRALPCAADAERISSAHEVDVGACVNRTPTLASCCDAHSASGLKDISRDCSSTVLVVFRCNDAAPRCPSKRAEIARHGPSSRVSCYCAA